MVEGKIQQNPSLLHSFLVVSLSAGIPIQIDTSGPVTEDMLVKVTESSANGNTASPRKKRKVSFAPNLPTSYSKKHGVRDVGRASMGTESVSRRSTRSSTQQNGGAANPPQDVESSPPIPSPYAHALIRNTKDSELREYMEKSESLGSTAPAAERLSDEESVCSSVSSVASTSDSVSSQRTGVASKRRGRPPGSRKKSPVGKQKKAIEDKRKHELEVAQRIQLEVGRRKLPEEGQGMEMEVGMEPEVEQRVEPEVGQSVEPEVGQKVGQEVGQRVEPILEEPNVRVLSVTENMIARGW